MASYGTITVSTSATKIISSGNKWRLGALIRNTSSTAVYLGFDSSVTTATGTPLNQNDVWETNEPRVYQGDVYGIVSSSTADVRYEELV